MLLASTAPVSITDSIRLRLIEAISDRDTEGFQLLLHLANAQLGTQAAMALATTLLQHVPSEDVKATLQMLHGDAWIQAARSLILTACNELSRTGAVIAEDFSFCSLPSGEPVLLLSDLFYSAVDEISPHSLHLIRCFLKVGTA